jgi:hypothetical protein
MPDMRTGSKRAGEESRMARPKKTTDEDFDGNGELHRLHEAAMTTAETLGDLHAHPANPNRAQCAKLAKRIEALASTVAVIEDQLDLDGTRGAARTRAALEKKAAKKKEAVNAWCRANGIAET